MLSAGRFCDLKAKAPHGVPFRPSAETAVRGVNVRESLGLKPPASCGWIGVRDDGANVSSRRRAAIADRTGKWEPNLGVIGSEVWFTKENVQTKARASNVNGEAASITRTERVGKANKKKLAKDSDMPKRPPSAYLVFMETFRKTFKEENPDVKGVTASAKAGGEKWLQLSDEEKAPYISEAADRKAKYETAMATYKNGSTKQEKGVQN
ncbi:unnamed protein product [Sphagnum troendelagicum]|uniref:HMG box domain-containing protein n=1 Tax=Sphagnum troendelagicum TaxID=128251 RepID=A0ABP0TB95_9BRYO